MKHKLTKLPRLRAKLGSTTRRHIRPGELHDCTHRIWREVANSTANVGDDEREVFLMKQRVFFDSVRFMCEVSESSHDATGMEGVKQPSYFKTF